MQQPRDERKCPSAAGLILEIWQKILIQVKIDMKETIHQLQYVSALDKMGREVGKPSSIMKVVEPVSWLCLCRVDILDINVTFSFDGILSLACNILSLHQPYL